MLPFSCVSTAWTSKPSDNSLVVTPPHASLVLNILPPSLVSLQDHTNPVRCSVDRKRLLPSLPISPTFTVRSELSSSPSGSMATTDHVIPVKDERPMELSLLPPNQGIEAFKDVVFGSVRFLY